MNGGFGTRGLSAMALAVGLVTALSAVPAAMPPSAPAARAAGIDAATLFARVHVIGASASAGFGVRAPGKREPGARTMALTLDRIGECARLSAGEVTGDATSFFFTDPCGIGKDQVGAALGRDPRPTLVVADDFLFWFTYGALDAERKPVSDESQRLALLDRGLAELDRVVAAGIPLVVGDVPDMFEAVGRMLTAAQTPKPATLSTANARIRQWAAGKPRVAVMPLAQLAADLRSGKPFVAGRRSWSEESDGPLLQKDRLHPTFAGTVAMLARTEQSANERFLGIRQPNAPGAPAAFEHDPERVGAKAREAMAANARPAAPPTGTRPAGAPSAQSAP